jgi:predicted metal-dependent hydrolase
MAKSKMKMPVEALKASTQPETIIARRSHEDEARERKWKAEDALKDIERAEAHKRDKGLMKDVKACAKEKMKAYGKL